MGYTLSVLSLSLKGPECRHLDDFLAKVDVRQSKPSPDQTTVSKDLSDLFRAGIGHYVEILGLAPQEEIPDATTNQIGLIALLFKAIEDLQRIFADQRP